MVLPQPVILLIFYPQEHIKLRKYFISIEKLAIYGPKVYTAIRNAFDKGKSNTRASG
jgi:hypothetical protein